MLSNLDDWILCYISAHLCLLLDFLFVCSCVCVSVCLSVCTSVHICMLTHVHTCMYVSLRQCVSVCASVCLCICASVCASVRLSVCLCASLSVMTDSTTSNWTDTIRQRNLPTTNPITVNGGDKPRVIDHRRQIVAHWLLSTPLGLGAMALTCQAIKSISGVCI